jgi:hypothetical protein
LILEDRDGRVIALIEEAATSAHVNQQPTVVTNIDIEIKGSKWILTKKENSHERAY